MQEEMEDKKMKKMAVLFLTMCLLLALGGCGQTDSDQQAEAQTQTQTAESEEDGKQTATEYTFALADGEQKDVSDLIFEQDVTVSGENAQITFVNCEFQGNVINTASEGTRVILQSSTVEGQCVFQSDMKETTMEWSFPKFLVDAPVDAAAEDCIGSVIAFGDFEITWNGQPYKMQDATLFVDLSNADAGFVPYEGQEANYFCVAQWWENGEQQVLVECEYDPNL